MLARAISAGAAITLTVIALWLLAALSSVRLCVATRLCPPTAAFVVFQVKLHAVLAPKASPVTVCVPVVPRNVNCPVPAVV